MMGLPYKSVAVRCILKQGRITDGDVVAITIGPDEHVVNVEHEGNTVWIYVAREF